MLLRHLRMCKTSSFSSLSARTSVSNYLNSHLDAFLSPPSSSPTLSHLLQSHSLVITTGNSNNIFLSAKLISGYASFNKHVFCCRVFEPVPQKDTFLWNSIIKAHFSSGLYSEALDFYLKMRASDALPDRFCVPMVVTTCAELTQIEHGMYVHGLVLKCGPLSGRDNCAIASSLIFMYAKCGDMVSGLKVFEEMPFRDVVSWTTLVIGYIQNGENGKGLDTLCKMVKFGRVDGRPNFRTMEGGLQACGNRSVVSEGRCFHGFVVKSGLDCCITVQASVFSMYSKCDEAPDACRAFCELVDKDIVSWTTIIGLCSRVGLVVECLDMFWEMHRSGITPDGIILSCILLGLGNSMDIFAGKAFHGLVVRRHVDLLFQDQVVSSALMSMYCKFGLFKFMEKLFETGCEPGKEQWNIMVMAFGKPGMEESCMRYFREMQDVGIQSDSRSVVSVIASCSRLGLENLGKSVHCYVIKSSMAEDLSVANSLINFYGSFRLLEVARQIFSNMKRDLVSWNSMMSSYIHNEQYEDAVALFDEMIAQDLKPNHATLVTALAACSNLASLQKGEKIHQYINEEHIDINLPLATALVDMYAKSGKLDTARQLFALMEERDVISWNVMMFGYAMHGDAKAAVEIFQLMENSNVRPNALTFLALLSACARAGLLREGMHFFSRMQQYSIKPELKHYSCMVELLGKTGNFQGAEQLIISMPIPPDSAMWATLLSACTSLEEFEAGVRVAKCAIQRHPDNDGYYVLLSNICSSINNWDEAQMIRRDMKNKGMEKLAAWSAL